MFRIENEPLVEDHSTRSRHLSFSYDAGIDQLLPELERIGVRRMSFSDFCTELSDIIDVQGDSFLKSKPPAWHSKIAILFMQQRGGKSQLAYIPLIPLRSGSWVTTSKSHVFLEEDISHSTVPDGIDIHLVDSKACLDATRLDFFRWLGIKRCKRTQICQMIIERYNASSNFSRPLSASVHELIYLFQTPRTIYNESLLNFRLIPRPPYPAIMPRGTRFYIESAGTCSIVTQYAMNRDSNMPLIHPSYIAAARGIAKEAEFLDWICSRLRVYTHPQLTNLGGLLTLEFHYLKANAVDDLLLLLRDFWDLYHYELEGHGTYLLDAIGKMNVTCLDGLTRSLDETILPLEKLKPRGPDLPYLAIPEPEDHRWLKFSHFGVLIDISAVFCLRQLKAMATRPDINKISKTSVELAYYRLELEIQRKEDVITVR